MFHRIRRTGRLSSDTLRRATAPLSEAMELRVMLSASAPLTGTVIGTPGSYKNDGNTIVKVFDGNINNYFDGPTANGNYAGLDVGTAKVITQISYAPRPGYGSRMIGGVFQGSDSADFSGAVTTLYSVTSTPASGVFTTVNVSSAVPFRYVRYLSPSGSYGDVGEVKFIGYAPAAGETLTADGTLSIYGTNAADTITVTVNQDNGVTVKLNGVSNVTPFGSVKQIVVAGLGGDDTIEADYGAINDATEQPMTLVGGDGNDLVTVTADIYGDAPPYLIDGGGGNDTLEVDGDGSVTMYGGDGDDQVQADGVDYLNAVMYGNEGNDTIRANEYVGSDMDGGAGNDTLDRSNEIYGGTYVGGTGTDTIDVSNYYGGSAILNLDGQADSTLGQSGSYDTTLTLGTDIEKLNYSEEVESTGETAVISGSAGNTITVTGSPDVTVNCGTGDNTVTLLHASGTVNGNTGNDTIYADVSQPATINGGAGNDTAYVNPFADSVNNVENVIDYPSVNGTVTGLNNNYVTIYLDANNNAKLDSGELSVYVFKDGPYSITNVPAGNYVVRQLLEYGATQISPANGAGVAVTVGASTAVGNVNFVDGSGGSVTGTVTGGQVGETLYLDVNNNSKLDSGELSTTLQSNGTYSFTNVPAGAYIVRQVLPNGYLQTSPANNYGDHVTVSNGSTSAGNNFADKVPITPNSIEGIVTNGPSGETIYLDTNNNSKLDPGELSTTTQPDGTYGFTNVPTGSTTIRQLLPAGFVQTVPSGGLGINVTNTSTSSFTNENFTNKTTLTRLTGVTIGTAGSYKNSGNVIAKATDNVLTNYFDGPAADGNWVGYDLGSSKTISQVAFTPRNGYGVRMVGGLIEVSTTADFSSNVTTIYTISFAPADAVLTTEPLASPVTARYVRYLSPKGSWGDIAEFEVFG